MEKVMGLCAGRHAIPVDEYIFTTDLDPLDYDEMYRQAMKVVPEWGTLIVYVTGLTAAMLAVVAACEDKHCVLTAKHYDRESGTYKSQVVLNGFEWA